MPPKKIILKKNKDVTDTTIATTPILVTTKPKLNIIKSKKTIVEPIIETKVEPIEDQEEDADPIEDQKEPIEEQEEPIEDQEEPMEDQEEPMEENLEIIKIKAESKLIEKQKPIKTKVDILIKKEKEKEKDNMNNINNSDEKIHNHSKPKTITASTKDVNTVDMFGNDDLDFRYVMMNYDYTKNVTMPKITKYERALLIGKRAKQIEEGANPNVKYISGQSVISIAEEELRQRKIPLIIKRPIGNKFEYWKPADMEVVMD